MEQIGWFVVGEGKFGPYLFGDQKSEPVGPVFIETEDEHQYWKSRGYTIIPAYVNATDKEDYSFVKEKYEGKVIMTPYTLEYYTWDQIEKFLSNEMGTKVDWRLWLEINEIRNDSYVVTDLTENFLDYVKRHIDEYVDWDGDETPLKLIDAMRKLREELGKDVITIFYSW